MIRIDECILFKRLHGHLNVPPVSQHDRETLTKRELSFRVWASRMRGDYAKVQNGGKGRGQFGPKRIKQLETLGFVFTETNSIASRKSNKSTPRRLTHNIEDSEDESSIVDDDEDEPPTRQPPPTGNFNGQGSALFTWF